MSDAPVTIGPYTVLGALGRGGMGAVLRVRRDDLDKEFALKIIYAGDGTDPGAGNAEAVARFAREAQAQAKLAGHPGIVGVHDAGVVDGRPYLVMDLVQGRALDEVLLDEPLAPGPAATMAAQIARAVAYAHDHGILHRDLKPANVMVETGTGQDLACPRVRVTDFGLARPRAATPESLRLTRSGEILGTPAYMPPEQALGRQVDQRADVFSLGATLYEMVVGEPPFGDGELVTVLGKVLRAPPDPPAAHGVALPAALDAIIHCCLEKDPDDRYATAAALAEDLERFVAGRPVRARRRGPGRRAARAVRRHPWLATVALAAPLAGAGLVWWSSRTAEVAERRSDAAAEQSAATELEEQARAVTAAWTAAWQAMGPDVRRLEDHFNDVAVSVPERQEILNRLAPAAERLAGAHPGGRAAAALWIVAKLHAGVQVPPDQFQALLGERADPIPHVWVAKFHLNQWMRDIGRPVAAVGQSAATRGFQESDSMRRLRTLAEGDLAVAVGHELWPHLTVGSGFRDYVEGALALAAGRFEAAAERLARAVDDPTVGPDAGTLRAYALLYLGRFADAGVAGEQAARRGWPRTARAAGFAWMLEGFRRHAGGEVPWEAFDRSEAMLRAAVALHPEWGDWRHDLAILHWGRSQVAQQRGEDPVPHFEAAIAEHTRALEHDTRGETGAILLNRAKAAASLGHHLVRLQRDPSRALQIAVADFRRVREEFPGLTDADRFEADTYAALGRHWHRIAGDRNRPAAERDAAHQRNIAASRAAAELRPDAAPRFVALGGAEVNYGSFLSATGADPVPMWERAITDLNRALELDGTVPNGRLFRANGLTALARHLARTRRPFVPTFEQGLADYAAALQQQESVEARLGWAGALVDFGGTLPGVGRDGRGQFEQAIAVMDPAVTSAPSNPEVWRHRGLARTALLFLLLRRDGEAGEHAALARGARADLARAAELNPGLAQSFTPYLQVIDRYLQGH